MPLPFYLRPRESQVQTFMAFTCTNNARKHDKLPCSSFAQTWNSTRPCPSLPLHISQSYSLIHSVVLTFAYAESKHLKKEYEDAHASSDKLVTILQASSPTRLPRPPLPPPLNLGRMASQRLLEEPLAMAAALLLGRRPRTRVGVEDGEWKALSPVFGTTKPGGLHGRCMWYLVSIF